MITQGSAAHPAKLNDHIWGPRIKEVHWGGKPPMIIITGEDESEFGTLSGSRTTAHVFTETMWFVVSFAADGTHHVWATIKCSGVFADDVNLISTDPVFPVTADFTGYVPFDAAWVPTDAKDPGFSFNSRIVDYDYTKPITLVPTKLARVRLYRRGTSAQNLVDSIFSSQVAGDDGFRTRSDLSSEVSGYPATEVTITVYKDGTFTVDPTRGPIGQKGAVTVVGGTVLSHDVRSYQVFMVGSLVEFNNAGIIV